ncbi:MAG: cytochrome c3 family protein [Ignavibacteriaceae bacterium]
MKSTRLDYILRVRLPITIFVILACFTITFFVSKPERDMVGYSPDQPINFPHNIHAGLMKIDCQYCHTGVEKSRVAMVPPVATCMNCHTIARKDRPEIIKLTQYYKEMAKIKEVHPFTMAACLDCHRNAHENLPELKNIKNGPDYCFACHR